MYESHQKMHDSKTSYCPAYVASFDTSKVEEQLDILTKVCDDLFAADVTSLEQFTRGLMAVLCNHMLRFLEIEDCNTSCYTELWNMLNKAKWDSKRPPVSALMNDTTFVAILKLAAVVLGVPFPDKTNRLAWCRRWSSLLLTWRVARGFVADTERRPPKVQNHKLYLSFGAESKPESPREIMLELFRGVEKQNLLA